MATPETTPNPFHVELNRKMFINPKGCSPSLLRGILEKQILTDQKQLTEIYIILPDDIKHISPTQIAYLRTKWGSPLLEPFMSSTVKDMEKSDEIVIVRGKTKKSACYNFTKRFFRSRAPWPPKTCLSAAIIFAVYDF